MARTGHEAVDADAGSALLAALRAKLAALADPTRGAKQAAYMKSAMPYWGVSNGAVRAITSEVLATFDFDGPRAWRDAVLGIWRAATHREERYAAIALVRHRRARALAGLDARAAARDPAEARVRAAATLVMLEEMIVTGAWWDLVDELATHPLRDLLSAQRAWMDPVMRAWASDADLWKRRSAILSQHGLGAATDLALLRACIEPSLQPADGARRRARTVGPGEAAGLHATFWLRKAIGWALRTQARTHPDWVLALVDELGPRLSPLSKKEATKHLG